MPVYLGASAGEFISHLKISVQGQGAGGVSRRGGDGDAGAGDFHKDPADRLIVAAARHLGAALVTADETIKIHPHLKTIW
jgi:hypothetical protein